MTAASTRRALRPLALVLVVLSLGIAAVGCGRSHSHRDFDDDPEIHFTVHNHHQHDIYVEAFNEHGVYYDFGIIGEGDSVRFGVDDDFWGQEVRARCTLDGAILEITDIVDGMHWDVD
jgi:hypothetical protein